MTIERPIQGPAVTFNKNDVKRAVKAFGIQGTVKRYSECLNPIYAKKMINLIIKTK